MARFLYLLFTGIVFFNLLNICCSKKNTDTPEGRFLKACILEHRGSLKLSDAKEVCECILAQAKDSNIDLDMMAHEYTIFRIDPNATFSDDKMRKVGDDCFMAIMTSGNSRDKASKKQEKSEAPVVPANVEEKFLLPPGTAPTKKMYISFTTEKGRTFLLQSDQCNAGDGTQCSMIEYDSGLTCSAEMSFSIDPKYSGNREDLVGKTVPLRSFSAHISEWRNGKAEEVFNQVSSDFSGNNYLVVDSINIERSKALKVWGTMHCTMTSDGVKFMNQIDTGKFALYWLFY
jgi:hypothetical protein